MREWLATSRSVNQPMNVFLSLTLSDFFALLFAFGVLQISLFLSGIETIYTLLILSVLAAGLILFRYKHSKEQLKDYLLYFFWKSRGGVIYEPSIKLRQKRSRIEILGSGQSNSGDKL